MASADLVARRSVDRLQRRNRDERRRRHGRSRNASPQAARPVERGCLAAAAAQLNAGRLLRLEAADQPAGNDDLALARQKVVRDVEGRCAYDLDLELVFALGDRVQVVDLPLL